MRVLVFGTFDVFHPGHRFFLGEAAKRGELFVVVARDVNVRRFKGKPPLQTASLRRRVVQEAFPRARVLIGEVDRYMLPILTVQPDLILLGHDQKFPPGITEADLREAGVDIERLPAFRPETYKSSLLRKDRGRGTGRRTGRKQRKMMGRQESRISRQSRQSRKQ